MKKLICILAILLCATPFQNAKAQSLTHEGVDFWVAYPEVYDATLATFEIHISSRFTTSTEVFVAGASIGTFPVVPGVVAAGSCYSCS